jgi:hypothetical protein
LLFLPSGEPPKKRLLSDGGRKRLFNDGCLSRFGVENAGLGADIFRLEGGGGVTVLQLKIQRSIQIAKYLLIKIQTLILSLYVFTKVCSSGK